MSRSTGRKLSLTDIEIAEMKDLVETYTTAKTQYEKYIAGAANLEAQFKLAKEKIKDKMHDLGRTDFDHEGTRVKMISRDSKKIDAVAFAKAHNIKEEELLAFTTVKTSVFPKITIPK